MVGSYEVKASQGRRVSFEFEIRRNITLVGEIAVPVKLRFTT